MFHHFTVSGLAEPSTPSAETAAQAELAAANAGAMARNYLAAGYVCVLEGALARRGEIRACQHALAPYPLYLIVLAPPPEVSERREALTRRCPAAAATRPAIAATRPVAGVPGPRAARR